MRRLTELLFYFSPILVLVAIVYFYFKSDLPLPKSPKTQTLVSEAPAQKMVGRYAYVFSRLNDLGRLKLVFNKKNETGLALIEREGCQVAINGGFYDKMKQPLGLLVSEGKVISKEVESALFNGYVWLTSEGSFGITDQLPEVEFRLALQSGPLLYIAGVESELTTVDDKASRRSLLAYLSNGELVLLTVYDPDSVFSGPYLNKLPGVLTTIAVQENMTIVDALNLDGGSTSLYRDREHFLNEYRTVKSLFCVTR
jgi:exopolysaccharide biosynthesis protein